jgi:predicted aspartyl protease
MGAFYTSFKIECHLDRRQNVHIPKALVDSGSGYTWVAGKLLEKIGVNREKKDMRFVMAKGQTITRGVGFAVVRLENTLTTDEIVFAEPGDPTILGARTLEGLNLVVDAARNKLVAAGPLPAA